MALSADTYSYAKATPSIFRGVKDATAIDEVYFTFRLFENVLKVWNIESQIAELKSLIFQDGSEADADRENRRPRARFEPASWPPQGHYLCPPRKCAIKRLLISAAEQGKSGTLAFPGFITT
jgi:hypothetical protein